MTTPQSTDTSTADAPEILGIAHVELSVSDLDRSVQWYTRLLGARDVFRATNDEWQFSACAIFEPRSKLVLAFTEHRNREANSFSPRRPGLDHLSFRVADRAALEAWMARLDDLGIPHDGIKDEGYQDALTFRDPDGIALEFQHAKPAR